MKKIVRLVGSSVLAGSMLLGMTGCALTDVKNAGTEIMSNSLNFKGSKVTKYFNEDDDDYEYERPVRRKAPKRKKPAKRKTVKSKAVKNKAVKKNAKKSKQGKKKKHTFLIFFNLSK